MPLSRTDEVVEDRIFLIQAHHLSPNPFLLKTSIMKEWSNLSKAFSKSSLRRTVSFLDL
jgi:hypothetical protein